MSAALTRPLATRPSSQNIRPNLKWRSFLELRNLQVADLSQRLLAAFLASSKQPDGGFVVTPVAGGELIDLQRLQGHGGDLRAICPFPDLRDDQAMYELAQHLLQQSELEAPGYRHTDYLVGLGWTECRTGRWEQALETFAKANVAESFFWTDVDVELGRVIALHHTGRQEEARRQLIAVQRQLRRNSSGLSPDQVLRGRSLFREVVGICQYGGTRTLVYVDGITKPKDNSTEDLDAAERSVAVAGPPSSFEIKVLAAPTEIDDSPDVQLDAVVTCDGRLLQEGIDFTVEVDPARDKITIQPASGTFGNGSYGIAVEQTQFHVVVNDSLPTPRALILKSGTDESDLLKCHLVQHTLQAWSDGEPNHGWALLQSDDAGEKDVQLTVHFLSPQDAAQVAWLLATCADSPTRDSAAALELAERAVKYAGSDAKSWAALGAALYRAGRWEEAVSASERAERITDVPTAAQVVSAMAQWQLGNHAEALQLYHRVAAVADSQSEDATALSRLMTEAASLLGLPAGER